LQIDGVLLRQKREKCNASKAPRERVIALFAQRSKVRQNRTRSTFFPLTLKG